MIVIVYTTKYRLGGQKFERVAQTMENELKHKGKVLRMAIESKRDLKAIFHNLISGNKTISEFHFIGHSGMYGPMYGTVEYPEQFSPYEWKELEIPFNDKSKAYFHCCRSARWFTNFFAQQFKIETFGYHWYTTFSKSNVRFKKEWKESGELYSIGCEGKKSHGYLGSIKKYAGLQKAEKMKSFLPNNSEDRTYNKVAHLYDAVFQDIKVREDEWNWLTNHFGDLNGKTVLDIGCGNGALLKELAPKVKQGHGIDLSKDLLSHANIMHKDSANIDFHQIDGPSIPLEDNSVDLAISMLSFRYLDWDPLMEELSRVLKPNGKMLILDMVTVPPKLKEYPFLLSSKLKHYKHRKKYPQYWTALSKLVANEDWKKMLKYNPIRSEHEMKWYLESRFPNSKMETINIGMNSRIVAFDTSDFQNIKNLKLSYP